MTKLVAQELNKLINDSTINNRSFERRGRVRYTYSLGELNQLPNH